MFENKGGKNINEIYEIVKGDVVKNYNIINFFGVKYNKKTIIPNSVENLTFYENHNETTTAPKKV